MSFRCRTWSAKCKHSLANSRYSFANPIMRPSSATTSGKLREYQLSSKGPTASQHRECAATSRPSEPRVPAPPSKISGEHGLGPRPRQAIWLPRQLNSRPRAGILPLLCECPLWADQGRAGWPEGRQPSCGDQSAGPRRRFRRPPRLKETLTGLNQ